MLPNESEISHIGRIVSPHLGKDKANHMVVNIFGFHNHNNLIMGFNMSYVHGLGDAQEALAEQWDREHEWINSIKMPCPHCKSEDTEWEDMEDESDDWGIETTFSCFCNTCGKEFTHSHYVDMS